jgi:putative FmdB family regulatory protein
MPIYEYRCVSCGKIFEALQVMSAEPLGKCIYCQGKVEKLISASSFQFKGSGWYITDYKNKKKDAEKVPEVKPADKNKDNKNALVQ